MSWSEVKVTKNINHTGTSWLASTCWRVASCSSQPLFFLKPSLISYSATRERTLSSWLPVEVCEATQLGCFCLYCLSVAYLHVHLPPQATRATCSPGVCLLDLPLGFPPCVLPPTRRTFQMFCCNEAKALGEKVWEGVSWKCVGVGESSWHSFHVPWWLWLLSGSRGSWACDP